MIVNTQLAQSKGCDQKDRWETPDELFQKLDYMYHFTLDPCAEPHTAKCKRFYTEQDNGLTKSWMGDTVFVNPPYSRGNIDLWVEKCYMESKNGAIVVALLPVSTSSDWFHNWIIGKADLKFVNKRVRFKGAPYTAPFSSVIVIWGDRVTGSKTTSFHQMY